MGVFRILQSKRLTSRVCSVWRTIKGPNDDWPLLLLDWQSLDAEKDQVFNDIVYADEAGENVTLHPNPRHKWYYLSAQETEDVLVFRACGSADQDTIRKSRAVLLGTRKKTESSSRCVSCCSRESFDTARPVEGEHRCPLSCFP